MLNNNSAIQYNESILDRLKVICAPLFKYTPIRTFGYAEFFDDSFYFHVCSHKKWIEYQMSNIHKNSNLFDIITRSTPDKGFFPFIWPNTTDDFILALLYELNIWNGISFYMRTENSIREFYFGCDKSAANVSCFYRKDVNYLFHFINFFKEKAKNILDLSDRSKLAYFKEGNTIKPLNLENLISPENIQKFLAETPVTKLSLQVKNKLIKLAPRETECIIHLAQGRTLKEIANLMVQETSSGPKPLSERTVETYIINMKKKSGYRTTKELITMFQGNSVKWF